jgi:hypothetical protein
LVNDFWWLDENLLSKFSYLELGHCESSGLIGQIQKSHVADIDVYRSKFDNINVHRSLKLSDKLNDGQEILGPFIIDIDNENNLEAAYLITKQISAFLTSISVTPADFRIFFSGHKGFNVEIKPEAVQLSGSIPEQIISSSKKLEESINYLREINNVPTYLTLPNGTKTKNITNTVDTSDTIIDKIYGDKSSYKLKHPFLRLHDSINAWIDNRNNLISRKKIVLTYQELCNKSITDILSMSQV